MFRTLRDFVFKEPHRDKPFKARLVHNPFERENAKWRRIESNLHQGRLCGGTVEICNMDLEPEDCCCLIIEFDHDRNLYNPAMYGPQKLAREFLNPNPLNPETAEVEPDEEMEGWVSFWGGALPGWKLTDDFDLIVSMAKEFYTTGNIKAMTPRRSSSDDMPEQPETLNK